MKKKSQSHIEEMNAKADLQIQEARLSAKRLIILMVEVKAEKIISKGERDNEKRKQQKIQETQENYNRLKSKFDGERYSEMNRLKELEIKSYQAAE